MRRWRITYRPAAGAVHTRYCFVTARAHHEALDKFRADHPSAIVLGVICTSE